MKSSIRIGIDARLVAQTGVGRYIRNLLLELGTTDTRNEYVVFVRSEDVPLIRIPNRRWRIQIADVPWHSVIEQLFMPVLFTQAKLDVVHVPYFTAPVLYPGRFVLTIHDLTILHMGTGRATTLPYVMYMIRRAGYRIILRAGIRRASRILTVSEATRDDIVRHFPFAASKVVVAHEGVDASLTADDGSHHSPIESPYFLYAGNAYPHKNLEFLVNVFEAFKRKTSGAYKLVLAGRDDFFYKRLRAYVVFRNISESVVFSGYSDDKQLSRLYRFATAFLFPSLAEGFGLPALEALSLGCPVFVSDIPVFREILPKDTVFLDPQDKDAWVRALIKVAGAGGHIANRNPDDRIRKHLEKFSWSHLARVTRETYEHCAGV